MTLQPNQGRRLDGPRRRPKPLPTSTPQSLVPAVTRAPIATSSVAAGFEYKRRAPHQWRQRVKWVVLAIGALAILTGGFFGAKAVLAARRIIAHHNGVGAPALAAGFDPTKLKGEGDGRINILLLGVGGGTHDGADLSDTIMVASIDPKTRDVALLSIPRDLYVQIKPGEYGKINQANAEGGPDLAKQVVQKVIGVPIHYYVLVDFSGFQQAVNAVGGVDITVAQSLSDPEYPCDYNQYKVCGYKQAAGQFHMNGVTALKYARCRKGNCGDDYGRAARQQQVLVALRQRALQLSTLTNPVKISGLIDAVGDHVKTDLQVSEIQKLASIAKDVNSSKIVNKVLNIDADNYLQNAPDSLGAGAALIPKAGAFDYSDIQDFVKNIFVDNYLVQENAKVEVQNGTGIAGLASRVVQSLKSAHYNTLPPTTASQTVAKTVIYDYSNGKKPITVNYLKARFNCTVIKATAPAATPTPVASSEATASPSQSPDIRVILGADYQTP